MPETFNRWISIADEVYQETYALFRKVSIYPLVVIYLLAKGSKSIGLISF